MVFRQLTATAARLGRSTPHRSRTSTASLNQITAWSKLAGRRRPCSVTTPTFSSCGWRLSGKGAIVYTGNGGTAGRIWVCTGRQQHHRILTAGGARWNWTLPLMLSSDVLALIACKSVSRSGTDKASYSCRDFRRSRQCDVEIYAPRLVPAEADQAASRILTSASAGGGGGGIRGEGHDHRPVLRVLSMCHYGRRPAGTCRDQQQRRRPAAATGGTTSLGSAPISPPSVRNWRLSDRCSPMASQGRQRLGAGTGGSGQRSSGAVRPAGVRPRHLQLSAGWATELGLVAAAGVQPGFTDAPARFVRRVPRWRFGGAASFRAVALRDARRSPSTAPLAATWLYHHLLIDDKTHAGH